MNTFDFYIIEARSPRKADLLKAGVPEGQLEHRFIGRTTYGRRTFPRYEWVARLGYIDAPAPDASQKADQLAAQWAAQWAAKGLKTSVRYHAAN
jgi:hypothetical protein